MAITIYSGMYFRLCGYEQSVGRSKRGDNVITLHPSREHDLKLLSYNKRNNKMRKNTALGRSTLLAGEIGTMEGFHIIESSAEDFAATRALVAARRKAIKKANKRKKQARARTGRR